MLQCPSTWDTTLSFDEFEKRLAAWRLSQPAAWRFATPARPARPARPDRQLTAPRQGSTSPRLTPAVVDTDVRIRTPSARAYAAGAAEAQSNALAVIRMCTEEFGRPDLIAPTIGMSPVAARQFLIERVWTDAFSKARSAKAWLPR